MNGRIGGLIMPNEIVPVTVKTKDEFQAAVRLKRTAIIVDNAEIETVVKNAMQKSKRFDTVNNVVGTVGVTGVIAGIAAIAVLPVAAAAATAIMAVTFTSAGAAAISAALGLGQEIADALIKYAMIKDEQSAHVVLVRIRGKNAMKKGDTIQGLAFQYSAKNLKEKMKAAKK